MGPDTENGRVTLAVLSIKLDNLAALIAELKPDHDKLMRLEGCVTANTTDLRAVEKRIETLDSARKWEGRVEAIVAAAVAVGAWFKA